MPLIKCKECGNEVSRMAETCPRCGARVKRKPIGFGAGLFIIVVVAFLGSKLDTVFRSETSNASVGTAAKNTAPSCDQVGARKLLAKMTDPRMASMVEEGGWVVVRFGTDYASWTPQTVDTIVTSFANVDACIAGKARRMEFRSPSGKVLARADEVRGIKVY